MIGTFFVFVFLLWVLIFQESGRRRQNNNIAQIQVHVWKRDSQKYDKMKLLLVSMRGRHGQFM